MLLPKNTILSLSNSAMASVSAPLMAVAGVWGAESWKVILGFRISGTKFEPLEGFGEVAVRWHRSGGAEDWGKGVLGVKEEMGGFEKRVRKGERERDREEVEMWEGESESKSMVVLRMSLSSKCPKDWGAGDTLEACRGGLH